MFEGRSRARISLGLVSPSGIMRGAWPSGNMRRTLPT